MDEIIGRAIITTITTILMIVTARIIVFKIYTKGDGKYAEGKVIRFPAVFFWVGLLGSLLFGVKMCIRDRPICVYRWGRDSALLPGNRREVQGRGWVIVRTDGKQRGE